MMGLFIFLNIFLNNVHKSFTTLLKPNCIPKKKGNAPLVFRVIVYLVCQLVACCRSRNNK
jgi:hypothetical protein